MQGLGSGTPLEDVYGTVCEGPLTQEPPGSSAIGVILLSLAKNVIGTYYAYALCFAWKRPDQDLVHWGRKGRELDCPRDRLNMYLQPSQTGAPRGKREGESSK